MKRNSVLFLVFLTALTACNQQAKHAKAYHDTILLAVQPVIDSSLDYGDAIQSHQKGRALMQHAKYAALVEHSIEKVNAAGQFEDDTVLKHYSLEILGYHKNSLDKDFIGLLNNVHQDMFTDSEAQLADSLWGQFIMMQSRYAERFNWAEKKFDEKFSVAKVEGK